MQACPQPLGAYSLVEKAAINQIITEVSLNGDYGSDKKKRCVVQPQGTPLASHRGRVRGKVVGSWGQVNDLASIQR